MSNGGTPVLPRYPPVRSPNSNTCSGRGPVHKEILLAVSFSPECRHPKRVFHGQLTVRTWLTAVLSRSPGGCCQPSTWLTSANDTLLPNASPTRTTVRPQKQTGDTWDVDFPRYVRNTVSTSRLPQCEQNGQDNNYGEYVNKTINPNHSMSFLNACGVLNINVSRACFYP